VTITASETDSFGKNLSAAAIGLPTDCSYPSHPRPMTQPYPASERERSPE